MAVIAGIVLLLMAFTWVNQREAEQVVRPVDWQGQALAAAAQSTLPILVPGDLDGWVATSAGLRLVAGEPTWAATFVTAATASEQAAGAEGFLGIVVSEAVPLDVREAYVRGAPAEEYHLTERDGATLLVYGSLPVAELAAVAAGLEAIEPGTAEATAPARP